MTDIHTGKGIVYLQFSAGVQESAKIGKGIVHLQLSAGVQESSKMPE